MVLSSNVVICSSSYSTARVQGCIASWAETKVSEYLSFGPSVAFMCQQGCFIFLAQSLPAALKRRLQKQGLELHEQYTHLSDPIKSEIPPI